MYGYSGITAVTRVWQCQLMAVIDIVTQKTALMFAHSWKIGLVWNADISYGFEIFIIIILHISFQKHFGLCDLNKNSLNSMLNKTSFSVFLIACVMIHSLPRMWRVSQGHSYFSLHVLSDVSLLVLSLCFTTRFICCFASNLLLFHLFHSTTSLLLFTLLLMQVSLTRFGYIYTWTIGI
jgi:hypothetical protein